METSPPPMRSIPDDILEIVFNYCNDQDSKTLANLSKVCKQWKPIAQKILFSRPYLTSIKNIATFFNIISQDKYAHLRNLIKGLSLDETFHLEKRGKIENTKKFTTDLTTIWPFVDHWLGVLARKHSLATLAISGSLVSFIAPVFRCNFKVDTLILTHPKGLSTTKLANIYTDNLVIYGCYHALTNNPCVWYIIAKIRGVQNFTFKIENTVHYKGFIMDLCKALKFRQLCSCPALKNLNIHIVPANDKVPEFKKDFRRVFDKKLLVNLKKINVEDWYPCKTSTIQQERYDWKHGTSEIARKQTQNEQKQGTLECCCIHVDTDYLEDLKKSHDPGYYQFWKKLEDNDLKTNFELSELERLEKEVPSFRFAHVFSEHDSFAKRVKKIIGNYPMVTHDV